MQASETRHAGRLETTQPSKLSSSCKPRHCLTKAGQIGVAQQLCPTHGLAATAAAVVSTSSATAMQASTMQASTVQASIMQASTIQACASKAGAALSVESTCTKQRGTNREAAPCCQTC